MLRYLNASLVLLAFFEIATSLEIDQNHRVPLTHKDHDPIHHDPPHRLEHIVRDLSPAAAHEGANLEARAGPDVSAPTSSVAAVVDAMAVGVLVMGQVTYTLQSMANGNLLFGDGATVTANAPAATIDGQAISFGVSGLVVDASSTFPISAQPPPTIGDAGQVLATPPPDSTFQQFKGNDTDSNIAVNPKGGNAGSAKAGSNGSDGSKSTGVDNGATGRNVFGASAFALLVAIFAALLI